MIWLIVVPLVWASLAFILGAGWGKRLAIAGLALQSWFAFDLALAVGAGGSAIAHQVGGWGAPLGIDLAADGLSAAMLLLTHCVALPVAVYPAAYFKQDDATGAHFWPLAGFLLAGLNALFLSADLFNLYVTLELVGLAAVGLVAAGGGLRQVAAALRYRCPYQQYRGWPGCSSRGSYENTGKLEQIQCIMSGSRRTQPNVRRSGERAF